MVLFLRYSKFCVKDLLLEIEFCSIAGPARDQAQDLRPELQTD